MMTAPVLVVPLSSKDAYLDRYAEPDKGWTDRDEARWPVPYWHTDAAMAAMLMLLTATDEGLGACFFGVPAPAVDRFRDEFGVPPAHTPVGRGLARAPHRRPRPGRLGPPRSRLASRRSPIAGSWRRDPRPGPRTHEAYVSAWCRCGDPGSTVDLTPAAIPVFLPVRCWSRDLDNRPVRS